MFTIDIKSIPKIINKENSIIDCDRKGWLDKWERK